MELDVHGCEGHPAWRELFNGTAVGWLASAFAQADAVLAQISTGCVHSGPLVPVNSGGPSPSGCCRWRASATTLIRGDQVRNPTSTRHHAGLEAAARPIRSRVFPALTARPGWTALD